jgi:hypothetical protein
MVAAAKRLAKLVDGNQRTQVVCIRVADVRSDRLLAMRLLNFPNTLTDFFERVVPGYFFPVTGCTTQWLR